MEKLDLIIEMVYFNGLNSKQYKSQTLITIISIAMSGLLAETESRHTEIYEQLVDQKITTSIDSTKIYKNMLEICRYSNDGEEHSECASMVDLASRITSLTTAVILLFQFVFFCGI